ncbi:MAG: DMT family transporter [Candidatus Tectomicrobia bacterium]
MNGRWYILAAAILWGTTGTSQAFAPQGATPLAIGALRLIVGGLVLLALALWKTDVRRVGRWHWPTAVAAGLSTAMYQVTFFAGVKLTGVAVGTLIAIGSAPIFAGILGALFQRDRLTYRWYVATALAVVGNTLLVGAGDVSMMANKVGIGLALGAGLSYAVFTLVNKQLIQTQPSDLAMAMSFCLGAIILAPLLLFVDTRWIATRDGVGVVLHLGVIATGLSYALFGRGLRTISVAETATLSLTEPLTAAALGLLILGEQLTPMAFTGAILLLAGLTVLTVQPRR